MAGRLVAISSATSAAVSLSVTSGRPIARDVQKQTTARYPFTVRIEQQTRAAIKKQRASPRQTVVRVRQPTARTTAGQSVILEITPAARTKVGLHGTTQRRTGRKISVRHRITAIVRTPVT